MKFSINDVFSRCDQIRNFLQIWLHLLKKSILENFISGAVVQQLFAIAIPVKTQIEPN